MFNFCMIDKSETPPTLYSIMNSIVNYNSEEYTPIPELSKKARSVVFNFTYPLSDKIDKEEFETLILNKYLMRRINFETFTAFQIQLNVKLNEIMPYYNKMLDSLIDWNLLKDGEITERSLEENRNSKNVNSISNSSNSESNNISDRRNSDTPQNVIEDVKRGEYVTNYNFDTDTAGMKTSGSSSGNSETNDKNNINEITKRSQSDKIGIYKQYQENIKSVYSLIFNDLDCLFYQLVDLY